MSRPWGLQINFRESSFLGVGYFCDARGPDTSHLEHKDLFTSGETGLCSGCETQVAWGFSATEDLS